jgi:hypothetical protein
LGFLDRRTAQMTAAIKSRNINTSKVNPSAQGGADRITASGSDTAPMREGWPCRRSLNAGPGHAFIEPLAHEMFEGGVTRGAN